MFDRWRGRDIGILRRDIGILFVKRDHISYNLGGSGSVVSGTR